MEKTDDIAKIYNNYVDDMFTYGLYLGFRENDVVDAIHDVFYNLCERRNFLNEILNIKFYLFKSIRNKLLDITKYNNANVFFNSIANPETIFSEPQSTTENNMIEAEDAKEIENKIAEMLSLLSPRQQEIIYLHFIQEYDYKQVAEIMNINYDNCRKSVYKAFQILRNKYGDGLLLACLIHLVHQTSTIYISFPMPRF